MTSPASEIDALIGALLDRRITPPQMRRLCGLVRADAAIADRLAELMLLASDLSETIAADRAAHAAGLARLRDRPIIGRRFWRVAAAAVLVLAFAGVMGLLIRNAPRRAVPRQNFATLVDASHAVFGDASDLPTTPGSQLPGGFLRLESGEIEIEFYSGARVTLTGPAEFGINSENRGFLRHGKLAAYVPEQARGFTVGAAGCAVVDLGTRFRMNVGADGAARVEVLQGQVELQANNERRRLGVGFAANVSTSQAIEIAPQNPAADGDLLLNLAFDQVQTGQARLADLSESHHDAVIRGGISAEGRLPGTRSLQLRGGSDAVLLNIPGTFRSITLAGWFYIDALPNRVTSLMQSDGTPGFAPHWNIAEQSVGLGDMKLERKYDPQTRVSLRRWTHLAVVYDADRRSATFYRDGKAASVAPILAIGPVTIGSAQIGNWNPGAKNNDTRGFVGRVGSFAVWGRALSAEEIGKLITLQEGESK